MSHRCLHNNTWLCCFNVKRMLHITADEDNYIFNYLYKTSLLQAYNRIIFHQTKIKKKIKKQKKVLLQFCVLKYFFEKYKIMFELGKEKHQNCQILANVSGCRKFSTLVS